MMNMLQMLWIVWYLSALFHNIQVEANVCSHPCVRSEKCKSLPFGDTCHYLFIDKGREWNASRDLCNKQNLAMSLVSKEDLSNGFSLAELVQELHNKTAWIGGEVEDFHNWRFVNRGHFQNAHGAPKAKLSERKCGALKRNTAGKVVTEAVYCNKSHPFICRVGNQNNISETNHTWLAARSACQHLGGDLFFLPDFKELGDELRNASLQQRKLYFMGFRNFMWTWIDGTDIPFVGDPDGYDKKKCLMLNGATNKWEDEECNSASNTLCQKDTSHLEEVTMPSTATAGQDGRKGNKDTSHLEEVTMPSKATAGQDGRKGNKVILWVLLGLSLPTIAGILVFFLVRHLKKSEDAVEMFENEQYGGCGEAEYCEIAETVKI